MAGSGVEERIAELVEPSLTGLGFDLVRVRFAQGTLQIMAERRDETEMSVDDCATLSHTVSALLDVADPIKSRFVLEISSPGMDRPLTRLSDYERFTGQPARIETQEPLDGRKRFSGVVRGAHGAAVRLEMEGGEMLDLPFAAIAQARLDISSTLMARKKPTTGRQTKTGSKPRREKP